MTFMIAGRSYFAHELSALELLRNRGLSPEGDKAITGEWIRRAKEDRRSEVRPDSVDRRSN